MPESSLALSYDDIRRRVGKERGYRTDIEDWEAQEKEDIEFCLRDGSDWFYLRANHDWSFLSPLATITLPDGEQEVELPWDFGFPTDECIYFEDMLGRSIRIVADGVILRKRQDNAGTTGRPMMAAVVTQSKPGIRVGQQSKLIYWPEADDDYTVQIRYSIIPAALSAATPTPYGGAQHAGTLLECCLAASERMDGNPSGPHGQTAMMMLESSRILDRKAKAKMMATNQRYPGKGGRFKESNIVTYIPGP